MATIRRYSIVSEAYLIHGGWSGREVLTLRFRSSKPMSALASLALRCAGLRNLVYKVHMARVKMVRGIVTTQYTQKRWKPVVSVSLAKYGKAKKVCCARWSAWFSPRAQFGKSTLTAVKVPGRKNMVTMAIAVMEVLSRFVSWAMRFWSLASSMLTCESSCPRTFRTPMSRNFAVASQARESWWAPRTSPRSFSARSSM